MDKNIVSGKVKQAEGHVQDVAGVVTNDPLEQLAGKAKQVEGKVQEEFGKLKDGVRREVQKDEQA